MGNSAQMYAIRRHMAAKNAWYWVVHFKRAGKRHYRRFYELKLGGKKAALAAAIAWRDAELKKTPVLTIRQFHTQRRSNNTSGVPGVTFVKSVRQPKGVWQALIKLPDGRRPTKSFSVLKYGAARAFTLAKMARKLMVEMIDPKPYVKSPKP